MPADRRLTFAHVDAEHGFSGGEVQVFLLMEGLRTHGHRNVLLCPPGSEAEAEAARRGFETRPVRLRNHLDLAGLAALGRALRETGADLVQTNTGRDAWLGGLAAWRAGLPSVTTRRMDRPIRPGLRTRLTYRTFAGRVVAISPGVADCLRAAGVPDGKIVLVPEAVDPLRIQPAHERGAVREALGVAPDQVLVLGLGALVKRKGFDVLVEAVGALPPPQRSRVVLRLGGDGEARDALEAQTKGAGLADRIRFLGRRADTGDLLAAADVFVMPSRAEGLGVAALEAMGAGLPVIASRVGGLAFSVVDGETGLHVAPGDAVALARALAALVDEPSRRAAMGRAARARVEQHFLPEHMVAAYLDLYGEVLGAGGGPR